MRAVCRRMNVAVCGYIWSVGRVSSSQSKKTNNIQFDSVVLDSFGTRKYLAICKESESTFSGKMSQLISLFLTADVLRLDR